LARLLKETLGFLRGCFSLSGEKIGDKFNQGAQGVALVAQGFICEGAMNPWSFQLPGFRDKLFFGRGGDPEKLSPLTLEVTFFPPLSLGHGELIIPIKV